MKTAFVFALAFWLAAVPQARAHEAAAQAEPANVEPVDELPAIFRFPIILRLHGGVGFAQRARLEGDRLSLAAVGGAQLMLPANATQSFGVEVSYLQTDARSERRYLASILFVEARLFGSFLLSIGLGAYVPLVATPRPTPIGISTKLGWAPRLHPLVNPFIVVRTDTVFDDRIVGSLVADFGLAFSLAGGKRGFRRDCGEA